MRLFFDYEGEAKRLRELAEQATTPGLKRALRQRADEYQAIHDGQNEGQSPGGLGVCV